MHMKASTGKIRQTYGFIRGAPQSVRRANDVLGDRGGSRGPRSRRGARAISSIAAKETP